MDLLELNELTVEYNGKNDYSVFDNQKKEYRSKLDESTSFSSVSEIIDNLEALVIDPIISDIEEGLDEHFCLPCGIPTSIKEFDDFFKSSEKITDELKELGYGANIVYIDLIVNHLDDVDLEILENNKNMESVEL